MIKTWQYRKYGRFTTENLPTLAVKLDLNSRNATIDILVGNQNIMKLQIIKYSLQSRIYSWPT